MAFTFSPIGKGRLSRRILGPFLLIVAILAAAGMTVTTRITAQSLEARAQSQLTNDAAIVSQLFDSLEEDIIFHSQFLANTEMLTENLAEPTVSRSLVISLLSTLQRRRMTVHLYKKPPPAAHPNAALIRKGFLGIRTISLIRTSRDGAREAWVEGVAPIETKEGVDRVLAISFPLTPSYLRDYRRRIGSDITLLLPNEQTISTLSEPALAALLEQIKERAVEEEKIEEPLVLATDSLEGPAKTLVSPFRVNLKQEGLLLLTMPMGDLLAAKRNIFYKGLLITLIILSAASLLYLSLIRKVTKPLEELSAATQDIARGNLDLQVQVTTRDEVGELADSFNAMVQRLKESRTEIEEWGRTLEERVEERTREIERARNELQETNLRLMVAMDELREAQHHIIRSEKMASLGRLVAGVAHEVINPVNAINLICQNRIRNPALDYKEKEDLDAIQEEVRRVVKITENLRSFARQSPQELDMTDINALLREIFELIKSGIVTDDIQVHKDLNEDLHPIMADADQIRQVFFNIITNALDAMPNGGHLHIRTASVDRMVQVSIKDTGHGIPPENLSCIFDPFFTTKPEGKGTGLGLSICHGIIENHQGTIEVESEVGKGTSFIISLPFLEEDRADG